MITPAEALAIARSRIEASAPQQADQLGRWFQTNTARLLPWTSVVTRSVERSGGAFGPEAASRIVEQLLGRLAEANPGEAAWGRTYQGLLELFVRVAIEQAAGTQAVVRQRVELPTQPAERTRINILAAQIAATDQAPSESELDILRKYTGFGGLSIARIADKLPSTLVPDAKALIDEYYTPIEVCEATAALISILSGGGITGPALEPSAGIGRFIGAFAARPDMQRLAWTAVEYSALSSRILAKLYPFASVHNVPFEQWVLDNFNQAAGSFGLVVTNPPYGKRGKNKFTDPDKAYREDVAYVYFIRRAFDLLRPGGLGVALVPSGLLTGTSAVRVHDREKVLRRHHLLCAYRLPSDIYPGADLVTDLSFWQSRGGELGKVLPEDEFILKGAYFQLYPQHILGVETESERGRYAVAGEFRSLPAPEPRELCQSCTVQPFIRAMVPAESVEETLDARLRDFLGLAGRVSAYLDLAASTREQDKAKAYELHPELVAAVSDWLAYHRQLLGHFVPADDRALTRAANTVPVFAALLSIFSPDGTIKSAFLNPPRYESTYQGVQTIVAHAEWLFAKFRRVSTSELRTFRSRQGLDKPDAAELEAELLAQGWCEDWPEDESAWFPGPEYYAGDLWPKLRRARRHGGERAKLQEARLLDLIGVATLDDAAPTLRDSWVPTDVIREFLLDDLKIEVPQLHWSLAAMKPVGVEYKDILQLDERLQNVLGYINHDFAFFHPQYKKTESPETGEEESAQQALDRVRLEFGARMTRTFREWLGKRPDMADQLLSGYLEKYRGYLPVAYSADAINIARWGKRITLRPHQLRGAWRLIKHNGGLLAFDVGVGKTLTGIAVLAYLRQIGRARRPIVIVPNSIIWKWFNEILRALPDYRIVVIGSTRYMGRGNVARARLDEKGERLQKWNEFKLGLYDVALVTFSVFPRLGMSEESLRLFLEETPTLLRQVGLKAADLDQDLDKVNQIIADRNEWAKKIVELEHELSSFDEADKTADKTRKKVEMYRAKIERSDKRVGRLSAIKDRLVAAQNPSERNRAILAETINEWVAEQLETQQSDGIDFESLRCDFLMLDEAQNMKNLWPVAAREGGVPKYLGAISEGSERAFAFALQAFLVQRETGGTGVALLSATPAKNSPLEFFTLLGFVDHYCWTRRGIYDPDYFIDRYLRLEMKTILKPDGKVEARSAVVGFQVLNELRDIVNRYSDFKTAKDVGLKLPETATHTEFLAMNEVQKLRYADLRFQYQEIVTSRAPASERYKALVLLQKMGLVALHPDLENPPEGGWSWATAGQRKLNPSPKLLQAVEIIKRRPDCGVIVFVDNVAVHRWLFDLLVLAGIAAGRIAVLNAERAPTPLQRQEIADGFNGISPIVDVETGRVEQEGVPPIYDVVIANAIAYEGIDLQVRTCQVIHLDLPWEPATLQQRNGRAVRQFNTLSVVDIFYLLSEKSTDAVRLAIIRGKLRWMSDILEGAERETNNPAAAMDLSIEDMLLMLADDPEAAKQAMEEIRKRNEAERNTRAVAQAWSKVLTLISLIRVAERETDEAQREQIRKQILSTEGYLRAVPDQLWPWSFIVDIVMSGIPAYAVGVVSDLQLFAYRAIWEGLALPFGAGRTVHFGRVDAGGFSWRDSGSHLWVRGENNPAAWTLLAEVPPGEYQTEAPDDSAAWQASLEEAIGELSWSAGMGTLGLFYAPDYWSGHLWELYGKRIVAGLAKRYRDMPLRTGDTVKFESGSESEFALVIPPTNAGYAEWLSRIKNGRFTYSAMDERSKEWWGRDFPRGVADDREILELNLGNGDSRKLRAEATYAHAIAVVQVAEDEWRLAHVASSQLVEADGFGNLDTAKQAARWLAQQPGIDASTHRLDSREQSVLLWIQQQPDLPSLTMVQAQYDSTQ